MKRKLKSKTRAKRSKSKVFGFWSYSTFPYILGAPGKIVNHPYEYEHKKGMKVFKADGFDGLYFEGFYILPLQQGKELKTKLDALEDEYNTCLEAVKEGFLKRRNDLLPDDAPFLAEI